MINRLYTVYWFDPTSDPKWRTVEELKEWAKKASSTESDLNKSSGYITVKTKNYVVVSSETSLDGYGNHTLIPRPLIKKIVAL